MDYDDNPYLPANELLKSVSKDTGIPLDQLNFVATQVVAIVLAPLFRCVFHPNTTKPAIRHAFALTSGIILAYFAFGTQAIHLAGLPSICYLVMRTQDPQIMQRMVMAVALMYLSVIHVHRLIYDSGTYSMDVTGPLMVMTQKVTSLAFSLHDGTTESDEKLTPTQRRQAIRALPTLLEYFSYMLHFQSLMAGPIVFYNDYLAFIDGSALRTAQPPAAGREAVSTPPPVEPSPVYPALKKITISIICALIFTNFSPFFPIKKAKEPEFFEKSVLGQLFFLGVATMMVRFKYYHAWILADGICNLSGLGFAGYNASGEAQWDLVSNVDIIDFELGLSLRECIAHWNKGTNAWLRFVVYERVGPAHRTLLTFALSAIWHGFYPGYYMTFATGALFTVAARSVRRHIRPLFLSTQAKRAFYDFLTLLATRIILAYTTFSFVLLEFWASVRIYTAMYFWLHLVGLASIYLVPKAVRRSEAQLANRLTKLVSNTNGVNTFHG